MHKILIVDDDLEILKLMKNALELKNYAVTVLQEVTLPIKLAEFQGYDLILLDIMLTNISGIELCKQLRNQIATPIIFISAKDTEDDILQGLANG
ncbi:MAG: response regulator, partial [Ligilactobacillus sp.]|nr:response regulator [Ligilactobacillus sp.]